jgi:predicted acetyltransferase
VTEALFPVQLVMPSAEHADSYRALVREFVERGEPMIPFTLGFAADPFDAFLEKLAACSRGEGIPEGFVPHSTFWLLHGREVVGVSNVRHRLTEALRANGGIIGYSVRPSARGRGFARALLRLTLDRARGLGLSEAWMTCAKSNAASARTMLANGAVLVSEAFIESRGEIVQRYLVSLTGDC